MLSINRELSLEKSEDCLSHPKVKLFFELLRIRLIEEAIAERHKDQVMRCPIHLSIGQEAVSVGISAHLTASDYTMSTHRSHAHYLAKGGSLKAMFAEFYGKKTGCAKGRGGSMHLIDLKVGFLGCVPIVGSTIPIGVGAAFGAKLQNKKNITVIFHGDGATEEGVFYESLNFAKLHELPVLFVCENNLYSITTPLEKRRSMRHSLSDVVEGFGIETHSIDGQDCFTVEEKASQIIDQIRSGSGPKLLECMTFRFLENCGPHSDSGLRPDKEIKEWMERDPLKLARMILIEEKLIYPEHIDKFTQTIQQEIDEAIHFALESSYPDNRDLYLNIYA